MASLYAFRIASWVGASRSAGILDTLSRRRVRRAGGSDAGRFLLKRLLRIALEAARPRAPPLVRAKLGEQVLVVSVCVNGREKESVLSRAGYDGSVERRSRGLGKYEG